MLATLVDKPFDEPGWLYEVKWDGYRALAFCGKKEVSLLSRNKKTFDEKFYPIHQALVKWGIHAVLDGEVVVTNKQGLSDFNSLQNWRSEDDGELLYYLFDILWLDGHNLMQLTLEERRDILRQLEPPMDNIRISENFNASGTDFFAIAEEMKLEGIIAKKAESTYHPGERSREWLKIKTQKRHEVVIGGYTVNTDSPKLFSSLLVGVYENGQLQYTGKIGTGFSDKLQKEMMQRFKRLARKTSPFTETPDVNKPSRFRPNPPKAKAVWLKPELVCEVGYRETTPDGVMRQPSFEGLREDKKASTVTREKPEHTEEVVKDNALTEEKIVKPTGAKNRKTLLNPTDETQVRVVEAHELKFTNLSKLYWPKEKISKRDLINYYYQAAPYMVPYLDGRPQSLNRHPNGISGKSFYQKNVTGKVPEWMDTFPYHSDADGRDKNFLVCNGEASLLYMASLGCIEINSWSSRKETPDNPDWCIIDLDPGKNTFEQVIEAARVTKEVLDSLSVPSFAKTSGSTGMHIYIPLGAKYTYEHSKEFARLLVKLVHAQIPGFTSIERQVSGRKGKMYLDFLQNRPQATLAAPYSVRPKPGATVSMPLHWEEVKKGLKMSDFTIHNAIDRLRQEGDIFKGVLGKGIDMEKVLKKAEKEYGA